MEKTDLLHAITIMENLKEMRECPPVLLSVTVLERQFHTTRLG